MSFGLNNPKQLKFLHYDYNVDWTQDSPGTIIKYVGGLCAQRRHPRINATKTKISLCMYVCAYTCYEATT